MAETQLSSRSPEINWQFRAQILSGQAREARGDFPLAEKHG